MTKNKPWSPTIEHIKSMILATKGGYGITQETDDNGKRYHLLIWHKGKEEARFIGVTEKDCWHDAYATLVREGKIKP